MSAPAEASAARERLHADRSASPCRRRHDRSRVWRPGCEELSESPPRPARARTRGVGGVTKDWGWGSSTFRTGGTAKSSTFAGRRRTIVSRARPRRGFTAEAAVTTPYGVLFDLFDTLGVLIATLAAVQVNGARCGRPGQRYMCSGRRPHVTTRRCMERSAERKIGSACGPRPPRGGRAREVRPPLSGLSWIRGCPPVSSPT